MSDQKFATAVLSGGAPTCTLICGALSAIWNEGKTFNVFFTSGAGAIVGMMYLAPKGDIPRGEYMRGIIGASIADPIWRAFPLPYKAFYKAGPFNKMMHSWADMFHIPAAAASESDHQGSRRLRPWWAGQLSPAGRRLFNDTVDFWAAAMTPTSMNFFSEGMCAPYPFIDDVVDFDKLHHTQSLFLMNAYNITDAKMEQFDHKQADARHFWAAMAYPFVKAPVEIDGKLYSEGSGRDPLNLHPLKTHFLPGGQIDRFIGPDIDGPTTVVLMDVLGSLEKCLVRRPRNIIDAYGISVLTPTVSLARENLKLFETEEKLEACQRAKGGKKPPKLFDLLKLEFEIPPANDPYVSDWSHENMCQLFDIGCKAGRKFVEEHGDLLPDHDEPIKTPLRRGP